MKRSRGRCPKSSRRATALKLKTNVTDTKPADGPLAGIRVIDLTNVIMGPLATHILADMGADVIKIEAPEGDSFRNYHPLRSEGMAGSFLHLTRNKRSMLLDLKAAEARATLDELIATGDVFIHSLRPKAIQRLGYSYERVREINPKIVYCGAYGFGSAGPYGNKAAYDDLIQGVFANGPLRQAHRASGGVCDPRCPLQSGADRQW
jgi:crotonobetainyl-CoA:carnitine CoA-transferase CaiB-like acyl-CoA transferase